MWLCLSWCEETWKTAGILLLRHQAGVLQYRAGDRLTPAA
jgi:hypothetical protein